VESTFGARSPPKVNQFFQLVGPTIKTKFQWNWLITFAVILHTDRMTDRRTNLIAKPPCWQRGYKQFCHTLYKIVHNSVLQWVSIQQLHDNSVAIEVDRPRHRKSPIMQRFHVRKLFNSRESWEVQPWHRWPVFVIVTFILELTKWRSSKPMQLQTQLLVVAVGNNVNVRLLPYSNLVTNWLNHLMTTHI